MKKIINLCISKTNQHINTPKIFIDNLGWKDKEKLEIIYKGEELVIRKKGE